MVFSLIRKLFRKREEESGARVLDEEMEGASTEELEQFTVTRRGFVKLISTGTAGAALFPMDAIAGADTITVTISSKDKHRNSLWSIAIHYCDTGKLMKYYDTRDLNKAITKLATHNKITNVKRISEGQRINIPKSLLKRGAQRSAKESEKRQKSEKQQQAIQTGKFQSPFGGSKKPELHQCMWSNRVDTGGGVRRICRFDTYNASRKRHRHEALDVWGRIGTKLYPIKPGIVIGADKHYWPVRNGRIIRKRRRFRFARNNGRSVKIQTSDGFVYVYIHMKEVHVRLGQAVKHNTVVGTLGCSGNAYCNNPHVHITLHRNGTKVDPLKYLPFLK
jgi:murein DD-endopeptidase MepM/ murein hydrolase activator NlpD